MPLSAYMQDRLGSAVIHTTQEIAAGDTISFELVYTAGYFGIDDSGSLKIVQRFAGDMLLQLTDPGALNYVSVEASNGAELLCRYDIKDNLRPWGKTLYIKVLRGYLRQGDRITVRCGDPRQGSPGVRMQTFCEDSFELKVLVDAFATCDYVELPQSPVLRIVAGKPLRWRAVLPTLRRVGQPFRLALKVEDLWGNPSNQVLAPLRLQTSLQVSGLPEQAELKPGAFSLLFEDLSVEEEGDLFVELYDPSSSLLTRSNGMRIVGSAELLPFWGDLHGQSEETIGTNTVDDYFSFARDRAFLDLAAHQGNDFQITRAFWSRLQETTRRFYEPGRFVTFPGYEWSGNTGMGGDHNVYYLNEGEQIHRSSHALVYDLSDKDSDRHTSAELLETLAGKKAFVFAHVGGRYADLVLDARSPIVPAVEIHSAWGSFEWLLHDAIALRLQPGVVANSDDHKGRPGASYPGASRFGSYGGLTCFLCTELSREAVFECLELRHHYATTGCRLLLDVRILDQAGNTLGMMGDIAAVDREKAQQGVVIEVQVLASEPVERIDLFNGPELVETVRPFGDDQPSRRIRVLWEGAEYRGRGRGTTWDGGLQVRGNRITGFRPINFWNPEKLVRKTGDGQLTWSSITTGGFSGVDLYLEKLGSGRLDLHTPLVECSMDIADIGFKETNFPAGGLGRKVRIFLLPEKLESRTMNIKKTVSLRLDGDNPLYVRITQEDGHRAWSSPAYLAVNRA